MDLEKKIKIFFHQSFDTKKKVLRIDPALNTCSRGLHIKLVVTNHRSRGIIPH